jgi:beta-N-acetylhexosaminidase
MDAGKKWVLALLSLMLLPVPVMGQTYTEKESTSAPDLQQFYTPDLQVENRVDRILDALSYREMIAETIIVACGTRGRGYEETLRIIGEGYAGGVIFLGNTSEEIREHVRGFSEKALQNSLLLPLYAVDGEPLLIHEKITDMNRIPGAGYIESEQRVREISLFITQALREMGVHINYAPVCDFAYNREIIGRRSFGNDVEEVSLLASAFIETMQQGGVVATAKHFPGHGTAMGDSHEKLVFIRGDPPEIPVFRNVIGAGVISIMVGHMGVQDSARYDTAGRPSSLSRSMISGELKGRLGFKGIVVSDALNMRAVQGHALPSLEALKAGCDMVLMPENEAAFIDAAHDAIGVDEDLRTQLVESVRKIVRLKLILGLINHKKLEKLLEYDDI